MTQTYPLSRSFSRSVILGAVVLGAVLGAPAAHAEGSGSPRYTGPLVTPPPPLPQGTLLVEPYLINSHASRSWDNDGNRHRTRAPDQWRVVVPINYGVHERVTLGATLNAYYNRDAHNNRAFDVGDTGLVALFGLHQGTGPSQATLTLALRQGITTGHHDRLEERRISVASGNGASTTVIGLHGQAYFMDGHLRTRASTAWRIPGATTGVRGQSGFGTAPGFDGRVRLGTALESSMSAEYSLSPRWVLVGELLHERESGLSVHGTQGPTGKRTEVHRRDPASWRFSVLPAVEYHFSDQVGVLFGAQIAVAGRNTSQVVAPQVAVNMVF
ncbi:hypothetical protein [Xanthomonas sp. 60]